MAKKNPVSGHQLKKLTLDQHEATHVQGIHHTDTDLRGHDMDIEHLNNQLANTENSSITTLRLITGVEPLVNNYLVRNSSKITTFKDLIQQETIQLKAKLNPSLHEHLVEKTLKEHFKLRPLHINN